MAQRARKYNPYGHLRALLDATRELSPEEMAELQLELGYIDRALAIFERLLRSAPRNDYYRARCEWLARLATAQARPVRTVGRAEREPRRRTTTRPGMPSEPPAKTRSITPQRIVPVD